MSSVLFATNGSTLQNMVRVVKPEEVNSFVSPRLKANTDLKDPMLDGSITTGGDESLPYQKSDVIADCRKYSVIEICI